MMKADKGQANSFVHDAISSQTDLCILWPYSKAGAGYAVFKHEGKMKYVHRFVLEAVKGKGKSENMEADHLPVVCNQRNCINPRHLRWATRKENEADKIIDKTLLKGSKVGGSILKENQVMAIFEDSRFHHDIAKDYKVNRVTVTNIKSGKIWSHLTGKVFSNKRLTTDIGNK